MDLTPLTKADYLDTLCGDWLRLAEAGLAPERTGRVLPDRRLVEHGTPAVPPGTEQLTVHIDHVEWRGFRLIQSTPGSKMLMAVADVRIQLWRCVPTIDGSATGVPADEARASAAQLNVDVWCLGEAVAEASQSTRAEWATVRVGDVQPSRSTALSKQGASAGWEIGVMVALNPTP